MTKDFKAGLIGALAAVYVFIGLTTCVGQAHAAPTTNYMPNIRLQGFADATAAQTFATTSYADLAAASISVVPVRDPSLPAGTTKDDVLKIVFTADVIKATATTGTCAVYVNGAVLAKTAQTVDTAAKNTTIGGTWFVTNTTVGTQTVKIQCKSGDTNVFTVNQGHLIVESWDLY